MKNEIENEFGKLAKMTEMVFKNYENETLTKVRELPLNDNITLNTRIGGELVAYAFTKFSAVCTNGQRIKFLRLGVDDMRTLQNAISNAYDINNPE